MHYNKDEFVLISVSDKTGIVPFAHELLTYCKGIYASGGTAKALTDGGVAVIDIATLVGDPILGHRVVTLSRMVHAALLARNTPADNAELAKLGIERIGLVCVDMYPLAATIARADATLESVIESTDIGGPAMLRSAAKGQRIVIGDALDRRLVLDTLKRGEDTIEFRERLAAKAEAIVADYALTSARYRGEGDYDGIIGRRVQKLKYGENPRQKSAALYRSKGSENDPFALDKFKQIEGGDPSYINMTDLDCLIETFSRAAAAYKLHHGKVPIIGGAVKHGNFCGFAIGSTLLEVAKKVVAGDKEAISGGYLGFTGPMTGDVAGLLRTYLMDEGARIFDGVIAPDFDKASIDTLARKTGKCRIYVNPAFTGESLTRLDTSRRYRKVRGGFLLQDGDSYILQLPENWKYLLSPKDQDNVILAWAVGSTANSNSIILVKDGMLIGPGTGQRSRVMAAKLALLYADTYRHSVEGAVAYSDSFFPFPDGAEVLAKRGVKVIFATSGSINDKTVREALEKHKVMFLQLPDAEARGFAKH